MNIEEMALRAYPHDYPERSGYMRGARECKDDVLKELHAWACGEYNIAELTGEDERMLAFQDVKRKIMSMWKYE